jgi:CTP:molybdopterin cytidylyltransferase MocA
VLTTGSRHPRAARSLITSDASRPRSPSARASPRGRTGFTIDQLRSRGVSPAELSALALLTRAEGDDYRAYVQRIADAPGQPGTLARVVKLADLEDHLVDPRAGSPSTPPYAWARRAILLAHADAPVSAANVDYAISNVWQM